jgi:hypothetical protein
MTKFKTALKISLSFVALVLSAVAGAAAAGLLAVSDQVAEFLVMAGGLLATLGYTPLAVPPNVALVCGKVAGVIQAVLALHIAHGAIFGGHQHGVTLIIDTVGFVGVLLGYIGRYTPAPPTPVALDKPVPPAKV